MNSWCSTSRQWSSHVFWYYPCIHCTWEVLSYSLMWQHDMYMYTSCCMSLLTVAASRLSWRSALPSTCTGKAPNLELFTNGCPSRIPSVTHCPVNSSIMGFSLFWGKGRVGGKEGGREGGRERKGMQSLYYQICSVQLLACTIRSPVNNCVLMLLRMGVYNKVVWEVEQSWLCVCGWPEYSGWSIMGSSWVQFKQLKFDSKLFFTLFWATCTCTIRRLESYIILLICGKWDGEGIFDPLQELVSKLTDILLLSGGTLDEYWPQQLWGGGAWGEEEEEE